jgi:hypothetical protein
MRDPTKFREYADECRRLASRMPEHKETLLSMADAWMGCAKAAEKDEREKRKLTLLKREVPTCDGRGRVPAPRKGRFPFECAGKAEGRSP